MDNILCAIDFSESSIHSLQWACQMSSILHSKLEILFTYRLKPIDKSEIFEYRKRLENDAKEKFEVMKKEIINCKQIDYDFHMEVGFLHDRIEERLKNNSIKLLVIGNGLQDQLSFNGQSFTPQTLEGSLKIPLVIVP